MSIAPTVLVTGGAGFIGSFLVDALVARKCRVVVYDNLEPQVHVHGVPDYLNAAAQYVWGDVRDYDRLKQVACSADVIFHEAAMVGVAQSQYQVRRYVEVNTLGTANLLDILANHEHHCRKLVVAASMSSYGEGLYECPRCGRVRPPLRTESQMAGGDWEIHCPGDGQICRPVPIPETEAQLCTSIYAITKRDQEEMVITFGRAYGVPTVALRYFNVYGPRQSLSNPYTGVAAIFMSRIKNDQPPVIYEDGGQSRDFVSVHDIVQANLLAMDREEADGEVFNVGGGGSITIREVAETLARLYGKPNKLSLTQSFRKGDVRHCVGDISKIRDRLGYEPKVNFEQGMAELIAWSRGAAATDKFDEAAHELARRGLA